MPRIPRFVALLALPLLFAAMPSQGGDTVYRWVDKQGRVHYGDRPPANATPAKIRTIPVPVEPSAMARLRVEPGDGEYLAWADNNLSGPIEVLLGFSQNTNMRGEPALPARATVPARGKSRPGKALGRAGGLTVTVSASRPGKPSAGLPPGRLRPMSVTCVGLPGATTGGNAASIHGFSEIVSR